VGPALPYEHSLPRYQSYKIPRPIDYTVALTDALGPAAAIKIDYDEVTYDHRYGVYEFKSAEGGKTSITEEALRNMVAASSKYSPRNSYRSRSIGGAMAVGGGGYASGGAGGTGTAYLGTMGTTPYTVSGTTTAVMTGMAPPTEPIPAAATKEDLEEMKQEIIAEVCDFLEKWLNEREDAR
jgi:hypothetical protein